MFQSTWHKIIVMVNKTQMLTIKKEKYYSEVGLCIYCLSDGGYEGLRDEHIIPYSLQGNWILPKSSCKECEKVTSKFERICAHDIYGSFRIREKLQTRRPEKRPTNVGVIAEVGSAEFPLKVPEKGAIALFPIFHLFPPGVLRVPPNKNLNWEGVRLEIKTDAPREPEHWHHLPRGSLRFGPVKFDIDAFAKLCAKIGHAYAVALFGLNGFNHWLPAYILGQNASLPYLIGSSQESISQKNLAHSLSWSVYEIEEGPVLAINIQIFPVLGQPPVTAVVGSLSQEQYEQIQTRTDKKVG